MPPPIAFTVLTDGTTRPIYEEAGRQFVLDDNGEAVFGIWFIPRHDECDSPIIVQPDLDDF